MINTAGVYILILIFQQPANGVAMTTHEFSNFDSCQAAITQLEPVHGLAAYCIAKEVKE
jgi:hypothetical protein